MVRNAAEFVIVLAFWMVLLASDLPAQEPSAKSPLSTTSGGGGWLADQSVEDPLFILPASGFSSGKSLSNNRRTFQFVNQHQSVGGEQQEPLTSSRDAKNGTGLDSLPSFRGIKGIKNLPGGVGTLFMSNPHVAVAAYPSQSTDQPGTSLSMNRFDFQGAVPISSVGANTFVLTGDVEATSVRTNAILPTSKQPFPDQFFNIAVGLNYFHQFEGGTVGGIVFDIGSASDKPFESGRDLLASGTGFLLIPNNDEGSWFVGVNASTNSQVLNGIPIPGGGYFFHPNDDF